MADVYGPMQGPMKSSGFLGALGPIGAGLGVVGGLAGLAGMTSGGPDYSQLIQLMQRYYGPQQLQKNTQQMYQMGLGSPGFQNQLAGINLAGNQFAQNLAARQGAQGFGGGTVRSGVGTVGQAAAPTLSSSAKGNAYGQLWQNSQQMALQQMMAHLQALQGLQPGMGFGNQFGNLLGAGMQAGGQYLGLRAGR